MANDEYDFKKTVHCLITVKDSVLIKQDDLLLHRELYLMGMILQANLSYCKGIHIVLYSILYAMCCVVCSCTAL
jgi:hypothetical protein